MSGSGIIYTNRRRMQALAAKLLPARLLNTVYTKILCGYYPNLSDPQTFNEKVQWLKLYYYPKCTMAIGMTDKCKVHSIIKDMGLGNLLSKVFFVGDSLDDINWDALPNKFVIKCNHGCAYNLFCTDKSSFNKEAAKKTIHTWLQQDFGLYNIEPHYSKIQRKVFIEEYLGDELMDYKFFCFGGIPKFLYVSKDLAHDATAEMSYFDMNWNKLPLLRDDYAELTNVDKPSCFKDLVDYSMKLSSNFPFVRVDFYVVDGKPRFSEMTFSPSAGMMPIKPRHFDEDWGKLLDISGLIKGEN